MDGAVADNRMKGLRLIQRVHRIRKLNFAAGAGALVFQKLKDIGLQNVPANNAKV